MNDLEAYCRADVALGIYSALWWDVFQWVRDHDVSKKTPRDYALQNPEPRWCINGQPDG